MSTSLSLFAIMLGLEGRARARMLVVFFSLPCQWQGGQTQFLCHLAETQLLLSAFVTYGEVTPSILFLETKWQIHGETRYSPTDCCFKQFLFAALQSARSSLSLHGTPLLTWPESTRPSGIAPAVQKIWDIDIQEVSFCTWRG